MTIKTLHQTGGRVTPICVVEREERAECATGGHDKNRAVPVVGAPKTRCAIQQPVGALHQTGVRTIPLESVVSKRYQGSQHTIRRYLEDRAVAAAGDASIAAAAIERRAIKSPIRSLRQSSNGLISVGAIEHGQGRQHTVGSCLENRAVAIRTAGDSHAIKVAVRALGQPHGGRAVGIGAVAERVERFQCDRTVCGRDGQRQQQRAVPKHEIFDRFHRFSAVIWLTNEFRQVMDLA